MGNKLDSTRDKIAEITTNWILRHVATRHYRQMIDGSIRLGLITAMKDDALTKGTDEQ